MQEIPQNQIVTKYFVALMYFKWNKPNGNQGGIVATNTLRTIITSEPKSKAHAKEYAINHFKDDPNLDGFNLVNVSVSMEQCLVDTVLPTDSQLQ